MKMYLVVRRSEGEEENSLKNDRSEINFCYDFDNKNNQI
jgi:hypothetical protein